MKLGISELFPGVGRRSGSWSAEAAQLIEEIGYRSVWLPEHVVFFPEYRSQYPYESGGAQEVHKTLGVHDPLVLAGAIAASTTTLRIGTYVFVVPQRNPIVTARQVASVDQLSGGRFEFGVGVGWSEEEYGALDVPFERRGERMNDYLAAMRVLWSEGEISEYRGEFVDFEPLYCFPKPAQARLPIIVGGNSRASLERIVAFGDGWAGYSRTHEDIKVFIGRLEPMMAAAGRSMDELSLKVGRRSKGATEQDWEDDRAYIEEALRLGIDEVVVSPRIGDDHYERDMRRYAEILGL
ncbi:LLM class F420-dependent oxidoreductase [Nocardioides lianchengensis]|uniref:Probable F420-dependent oxidoreductase, Rv2161c family n=1 Tax=Nocardioides lianchengensis TaxID=1045774 RepID=A0A1G7BGL3_9ACTN|nr:LLM class F420-dependent oxidoreductase [Nocardioides lianchengensis]NYG09009.1 putative F420-dependent oxidoreductase [Nocardioides lianchengensis]SDE26133.1 probable F420-dependent oxidoreductase, Rv2161c family [Nocardioides lianchengensis]